MSVRQNGVLIAGSGSIDAYTKAETDALLNAKQDTITGAATTITSSNLTADRAVTSNASGKVAVSTTTSTELGYVHGVTSAIQTQLNAKVATGHELIAYQEPTSSNNYIWYRKYKDGWVEQGCHYVPQGTAWTFPIPMANDLYTLVASYVDSSSTNTPQWLYMGIQQYSTYVTPKANGLAQRIYICGKAAS